MKQRGCWKSSNLTNLKWRLAELIERVRSKSDNILKSFREMLPETDNAGNCCHVNYQFLWSRTMQNGADVYIKTFLLQPVPSPSTTTYCAIDNFGQKLKIIWIALGKRILFFTHGSSHKNNMHFLSQKCNHQRVKVSRTASAW